MTNYYKDKNSLYINEGILNDYDLGFTAIGLYLMFAENSESYHSLEDILQQNVLEDRSEK